LIKKCESECESWGTKQVEAKAPVPAMLRMVGMIHIQTIKFISNIPLPPQ
jgi:hypothetical protein